MRNVEHEKKEDGSERMIQINWLTPSKVMKNVERRIEEIWETAMAYFRTTNTEQRIQ